ncbi:autotransporter outer membrane beta-barrel domain-containing protein [Pseudomonas sp. A1230]|uniref:autotransporter outer membrane beta-barrel domain-containing protein n=1 Tax=Pseudomonas sp. A1230 TaxID=3235106 RepID=UPI003782E412
MGRTVKGSYSTNGVGANVEIGKRINLKDGWFVELQLEITATRTQGSSYTISNGVKVKTDQLDSLQRRLGALVGRSLDLDNGMKVQLYAKASYITEHSGNSRVSINANKLQAALPSNRLKVGFGAVLQVSENSKLSLEAELAHGNGIRQPFGVNVVYRYLW